MAEAGKVCRKREERKQSQTSERDGPESKHEGPTVTDSSRGGNRGQPKRGEGDDGKREGRQDRERVLP